MCRRCRRQHPKIIGLIKKSCERPKFQVARMALLQVVRRVSCFDGQSQVQAGASNLVHRRRCTSGKLNFRKKEEKKEKAKERGKREKEKERDSVRRRGRGRELRRRFGERERNRDWGDKGGGNDCWAISIFLHRPKAHWALTMQMFHFLLKFSSYT